MLRTLLAACSAPPCSRRRLPGRPAPPGDAWSTSTWSTATPGNGCPKPLIAATSGSPARPAIATRCACTNTTRRARAGRAVGRRRQRRDRRDRASVSRPATCSSRGRAREIAGWRKSMDDVAQFVFTDLPDSYAARTGRPHNVGVVGVAVFREARPIALSTAAVRRTARLRDEASARARAAPRRSASRAAIAGRGDAAGRIGDAMQRAAPRHRPRRSASGRRSSRRTSCARRVAVAGHRAALRRRRRAGRDGRAAAAAIRRIWRDTPRAFPEGFVADPPRW